MTKGDHPAARARGVAGAASVVAIGHESGEAVRAALRGIGHGPEDRLLGHMAHHEHVGRGDRGVVGESHQRHAGRAGAGKDRGHVLAQQRAEDQLVAVGDRTLRGAAGAGRGIVSGDAQVLGIGVEQRHRGGIGDRAADRGIVARERHQQRDAVARGVGGEHVLDRARRGSRRGLRARPPAVGHRAAPDQRQRQQPDRQHLPQGRLLYRQHACGTLWTWATSAA